jgi:hypothetical protein
MQDASHNGPSTPEEAHLTVRDKVIIAAVCLVSRALILALMAWHKVNLLFFAAPRARRTTTIHFYLLFAVPMSLHLCWNRLFRVMWPLVFPADIAFGQCVLLSYLFTSVVMLAKLL